MIIFINLTGQILIDDNEPNFAWYDTIKDEFMIFNGNQDWESWKDFKDDLRQYLNSQQATLFARQTIISRFEKLYQFDDIVRTESKTFQTKSDPS